MSKKIVLIGVAYPYRGGIAHFTQKMATDYQTMGYEVEVITFSLQYPAIFFPGKTQLELDAKPPSFSIKRLINTINPFSWIKTARYIKKQKPLFVIFQYWMPFFAPTFGFIANRLKQANIASYAVLHNVLPHETRKGDKLLSTYFIKACEGGICLSESVKKEVEFLSVPLPIRVVSHPIYDIFGSAISKTEARQKLKISEEIKLLLFFGFIRKYKGLHLLLEALSWVIQEVSNIKLLVVGEFYDDKETYLSLINKLNISEQVILLDTYVPSDAVATYFCASDVVVQPYIEATQSGVAQIAFHFDKPMILTDVGGLPEIVPHEVAGLIVPPQNPTALATAIKRYFLEEMEKDLSEGVKQNKARFGWKPLYDALDELTQS